MNKLIPQVLVQMYTRLSLHYLWRKLRPGPRVMIQWSHRNRALCRFFRDELPERFAR